MCSKVLNGHIILTDTSITTILAPEMTYTPKIYTKTFVYFAKIQYIYNEINNRNIIMDILNFTYYFLIYNLIFN